MTRFDVGAFQKEVSRATNSGATRAMGLAYIIFLAAFGAWISITSFRTDALSAVCLNVGLLTGLAIMIYLLLVLRNTFILDAVEIEPEGIKLVYPSGREFMFRWIDPKLRIVLHPRVDPRLRGPEREVVWLWGRGTWPRTFPITNPVAQGVIEFARANRLLVELKYPGRGPSGEPGFYIIRSSAVDV
jgi:hypothetical protein